MSRHQNVIKSLLVLGTVAAALGQSAVMANVYDKVVPSTTWVVAQTEKGLSRGSGVLVDKERNLVLTNFHVTLDAREALVFFPFVKDGKQVAEREFYVKNASKLGIKGKVIAVDRTKDLALIQLKAVPEANPAIPFATESIGNGEPVHSIGNPGVSGALWVYSNGNVRAVYRKKFTTQAGLHDFKVVETNAAINSGDSGGPVVNADGELVALSQSVSTKARLLSNSVDISEIKTFMESDWRPAPAPIQTVLETAGLTGEKLDSGAYKVELGKEGAKRTVFVTNSIDSFGKAETRKVWSMAATLDNAPSSDTLMTLFAQNARTKLGAWTIEKSNEQFVMIFVAKVDATASPETYRSTMEYVSQLSGAVGKQLEPKPEPVKPTNGVDNLFK